MPKKTRHLKRDVLRAWRRGEISDRELAELFRAQLEEHCERCRRESAAARAEEIPRSEYGEPVRRARRAARLRQEAERVQAEMAAAPGLLDALRGLSAEQRRLRIRNAPERFGSLFLCELLFEEARACLPDDPEGSEGWAETVEAVAALFDPPPVPYRVRALAFQGNARRAAGDFESALVLFFRARALMDEHQVVDLELGAELHSFLGSLFTDLRRFEMAAEHLEGAASLYEILEDDEGMARVLMKLSTLHCERGDMEATLETDRALLELLSPQANPRLYLCARFNHALNLHLAGETDLARDVLVFDEERYEELADEHLRVRVRWLEGRIATEAGDAGEAEAALQAVRDHFVAREHGFNCALVCLDLAGLYHRQERWGELQDVAAQAVRLFQVFALHQEALAALTLLRDAAAAERVTGDMIRQVATFLQKAQRDPAARFERPN